MSMDKNRMRRVIGAEWHEACRLSVLAFLQVRWAHRGGRVPPMPQDEETWNDFIKRYSRGRCWYELMCLFNKHYDHLYDHPVALAFTTLAYVRMTDDEFISSMVECIRVSEHAAWVISRVIGCGIACGYLEDIEESEVFLSYVRANHREKWITLLWDLLEEDLVAAELVRIPTYEMTRDEMRVWMWVLLEKGELEAVEANLVHCHDLMTSATLLHKKRKYAEAAEVYRELSQSDIAFEKRFGEEGIRALRKRLTR